MHGENVATSVTIASGQQDSNALAFADFSQGIFILPAAFTGTAVTFKVSNAADGTFAALYDENNALVSITVTQGRAYTFPLDMFPAQWIKLTSGSAEAGDRTIVILLKY